MRMPWRPSECGHFAAFNGHRGVFTNDGDGAELADVQPRRRNRTPDDVGRQLELEAEQQPHAVPLPDGLARAVGRTPAHADTQQADERLERPGRDQKDRHCVNGERDVRREVLQQIFHDRQPR